MKKYAEPIYARIRQAYSEAVPEIETIWQQHASVLMSQVSTLQNQYAYVDIDRVNQQVDKQIRALQSDLSDLYIDAFYDLLPQHFAEYTLILAQLTTQNIPARYHSALQDEELDRIVMDFSFYLSSIGSELKRAIFDALLTGTAIKTALEDILAEMRTLLTGSLYQGKVKNLFHLSLLKHCNSVSQSLNKRYGVGREQIIDLDNGSTHQLTRNVHGDELFQVRVNADESRRMVWRQQSQQALRYHGLVPPSKFGSKEVILPSFNKAK